MESESAEQREKEVLSLVPLFTFILTEMKNNPLTQNRETVNDLINKMVPFIEPKDELRQILIDAVEREMVQEDHELAAILPNHPFWNGDSSHVNLIKCILLDKLIENSANPSMFDSTAAYLSHRFALNPPSMCIQYVHAQVVFNCLSMHAFLRCDSSYLRLLILCACARF